MKIRSINLMEHLISRGWMLKKVGEKLYCFLAPEGIKVSEESCLYIPKKEFEGKPRYDHIVSGVINTIADIYEEDLKQLRKSLQG